MQGTNEDLNLHYEQTVPIVSENLPKEMKLSTVNLADALSELGDGSEERDDITENVTEAYRIERQCKLTRNM